MTDVGEINQLAYDQPNIGTAIEENLKNSKPKHRTCPIGSLQQFT